MKHTEILAPLVFFVCLAALQAVEPSPPAGFRAIFNGKDLAGWHGLNPHSAANLTGDKRDENLKQQLADFPKNWRVENGELVNDGHGPYATTDEEYGDIELLLEYKTVPKADSGIYLRGTPQVQIWDWNQVYDPNNPTRKPHLGSGGLFNNTPGKPGRDPLTLADNPFGEWNQFRIRQIGDRTWVWLNGKLVVDGAVMENYWDRSQPLPAKVRIEKNVAYLGPDPAEKADLYLPLVLEAGKKYPAVVIIHGGGWTGGDKGAGREINIGTTLASHGYVCMSINYALAKAGSPTFPQNIQECKRAVRWLRKNADRFQIDAEHIGAIGGSAGGHLTALLAVSGPEAGLDPKEDEEFSCRIQAAVPMYPHCAASWEGGVPPKPYAALPMFALSLAEAPALWDSASPIKLLSKDDPPMLILHGTADATTPLDQSTRLCEAAKAAGVDCRLILVEGGPHSFHLQPQQRDLRPDVLGFFDEHLKPHD